MERITNWFLNQTPLKIFLLNLLGIPIYIWLFSIIFQLDKQRNESSFSIKTIIALVVTLYPILYIFAFIGFSLNLLEFHSSDFFDLIRPFHFTAMFCGFVLMLFAANSYGTFEKEKGYKTYSTIGIFFMLWFYFIGVWILQPNLKKYVQQLNY